ncbi:MAG: DUF1565 domain-containing protein [Candidatus Coatesbacteria bacterium]|nr:DUF1565 domain-containing protein [Candidatus Coatesbacteria bacterium]
MNRPQIAAYLVVSLLLLPTSVLSVEYFIDAGLGSDSNDGSRDAPWRTITHAISSVEGSEETPVTVLVAAGSYSGATNGETFPLTMKSWVSVIGKSRETTILDAEGLAYHVIVCDCVNHLIISGLTVTGGNAHDIRNNSGGGIFCIDSSPVIIDNIISENTALFAGGGIECGYGAPTISGNTIINNIVTFSAPAGLGNGGGIDSRFSSPLISDNLICFNSAGEGGGISCLEEGSPEIVDNLINQNDATYGGGVFCHYGLPSLRSNKITENRATLGGAIDAGYNSPVIENNWIAGNEASGDGGAINCPNANSSLIQYNVISSNNAGSRAPIIR